MLPPKTMIIRYKAYTLGGIYANVFISAISLLLLLFDSFYTTLFFVQLLFIGIIKIITNLFPTINHDIPNDGYVLRLLRHNAAVQKITCFTYRYMPLYFGMKAYVQASICMHENPQRTKQSYCTIMAFKIY